MTLKDHLAREAGDVTAGALTLGVLTDVVPVVLGILGVAWFLLRFWNFYRVNVQEKKPWMFY